MFKKVVKGVKDIRRLDEIIHIIFSEGLGFLIKKKYSHNTQIDGPQKLRIVLERLGPTFIKFGQVLSVRPDLVPMRYIRELERLQSGVAPFRFEDVKQVLVKEYNKPLDRIFREIDKKPIASASISQVHAARLLNGRKVAIKVLRPNIEEIMQTDIDIMFKLAGMLEKRSKPLRKYRPTKIVHEFSRWTLKEIDFRNEARNAMMFYENFKKSAIVKIPKVYDDISTKRVLVTEFINGTDIRELDRKKYNIKKVVRTGFEVILTQVFKHGFFHADPHPGNLFVTPKGKIAMLDFGIVGHFNSELREKSVNLFVGILNDDVNRVIDTFLSMNTEDVEIDRSAFKEEIEEAIFPLQAGKLRDVHVSHVLEKVLDIALKYNVRMPIDFILLGKTILTIEGVALGYSPDFNLTKSAKPFLKKLVWNNIKPKNVMSQAAETGLKYKEFIEEFPTKASRILDKIEKGRVKVDIEDTDIKQLTVEMGRSSNRVAYGLVIAALVIGSSITLSISGHYALFLIATFGYVLATILGVILIVSIIRENQ